MDCEEKYDDILQHILQAEKHLIPFLDVIFGFLFRRTDLYIVKTNPDAKIGFLHGSAERVVRNTFKKWQSLNLQEEKVSLMQDEMTDLVIHEEEVVTTEEFPETMFSSTEDKLENCDESLMQSEMSNLVFHEEEVVTMDAVIEEPKFVDISSETFNGADCGNYRWSQTASDVDIKVPVPRNVRKASDVRVTIEPKYLEVSAKDTDGMWHTLLSGELRHKHLCIESLWTLLPRREISIHLEKPQQFWWDGLLTTEEELDLTKLDVSAEVIDLHDEDHMQMEKVIIKDEKKHIQHQENLDVLREAWKCENSPFKEQVFDPSILQFPQ